MQTLKNLVFVFCISLCPMLFAADSININTADKEMLMTVSGIGEKRAQDIIRYREESGGFKSVQELTKVHGIGQSMLEKNSHVLTVGEAAE